MTPPSMAPLACKARQTDRERECQRERVRGERCVAAQAAMLLLGCLAALEWRGGCEVVLLGCLARALPHAATTARLTSAHSPPWTQLLRLRLRLRRKRVTSTGRAGVRTKASARAASCAAGSVVAAYAQAHRHTRAGDAAVVREPRQEEERQQRASKKESAPPE